MNDLISEYLKDLNFCPTMPWATTRRHFWCIHRLRKELERSKRNKGRREANLKTIMGIRNLICEGNLRLVVSCTRGCKIPILLQDLIAEGNHGLLGAIAGFNVQSGYRFSTYACVVIKSRMRNIVNSQSQILTRGANQRVGSLIAARNGLQVLGNTSPTDQEMADWLNENGTPSLRGRWKAASIILLRSHEQQQQLKSLDRESPAGETLYDMVPGKDLPSNEFMWESMKRHISDREFAVMKGRFQDGEILKELGKKHKLTRERIRQIEKGVVHRMQIVVKNCRVTDIPLVDLLQPGERHLIRGEIARWSSYPDPPPVLERTADSGETLGPPNKESVGGPPMLPECLTSSSPASLLSQCRP